MLQIPASMADECMRQLSVSDRARYFDTADGGARVGQPVGPELARLAFDQYGLTPKPAAAAIGFVQMSRPNAGAGAGTIKAGTRIQAVVPGQAPITFTLNQDVTFTALGLNGQVGASTNLPATSTTTGSAAGVAASGGPTGPAWSFVDPAFDATIVISNLEAFIGSDAQDSADFLGMVRAFFSVEQKAILAAIQFGALQVPQVSQAVAIEVVNALSLPPGISQADASIILAALGSQLPARYVQVFIGDKQGNSNLAMIQAVRLKLLNFRAGGIMAQVIGQIPQTVFVQFNGVAIPAGLDPAPIILAIQGAVAAFINSLPSNSVLQVGDLATAGNNAGTQAKIPKVGEGSILIGTSPNALGPVDLEPAFPSQVFRTEPANIVVLG